MTLDAHVQLRLGSLHLDAQLVADAGEVVALLGPNGAGKTTLLRCLAGLHAIDGGSITFDGVVVDDPDAGVFEPSERRHTGMVFQNYLLFDHLSAVDNVAFGLRARGDSKSAARRVARDWVDRVGLADHSSSKPPGLSGGQQQRVALARALATDPQLLLLDEPLAALDAGARNDVRRDLRRHLSRFDGITVIVTHDPVDAYALADRVAVLEDGTITQTGSLADITAQPRSKYVADLADLNLVQGRLHGDQLTLPTGGVLIVADGSPSEETFAAIHPNAVALYRTPPEGSPRNVWQAPIRDIDAHLQRVRVRLDGAIPITAEITRSALTQLGLQTGDSVWASVKATDIATYPA